MHLISHHRWDPATFECGSQFIVLHLISKLRQQKQNVYLYVSVSWLHNMLVY